MGAIVRGVRTPRSARDNFGCTLEHLAALATSLAAPATSLAAPATSLAAPATGLGSPRITLEQSGNKIFFGNAAGAPAIHSYYLSFSNF